MANSLDATVTLAPHSAPLDKANGRRRICPKEKAWTWRDARFLHMGTSMSDGTADPLRYDDESRTSSRPSTRRTKTVLLPFPLLGLRLNHDGPIVHDCGRFGLIAVEVE